MSSIILCQSFLTASMWNNVVPIQLLQRVGYDAGNILMILVEQSRLGTERDGSIPCQTAFIERRANISQHRQKLAFKELSLAGFLETSYKTASKHRYVTIQWDTVLQFFMKSQVQSASIDTHMTPTYQDSQYHKELFECLSLMSDESSRALESYATDHHISDPEFFNAVYHGASRGIVHILRWLNKTDVFDANGIFTQGQYLNEYATAAWFFNLSESDKLLASGTVGQLHTALFDNYQLLSTIETKWKYAHGNTNEN